MESTGLVVPSSWRVPLITPWPSHTMATMGLQGQSIGRMGDGG